jgi:hypothetical protein
VPDLWFHDLRTAVRNMIRRGIPQHIAVRISGRKTMEVFHHYAIVSSAFLREAASGMEQTFSLGTIEARQERKGDRNLSN